MDQHSSPDSDLVHSTAIVCKDVPIEYCDRARLRSHFSQFGNVTKVFTNPEKLQASVHFDTRLSAANAVKHGKDGTSMKIFWKRPTRKSLDERPEAKPRRSQGSESTDDSSTSGVSSLGMALSPTTTAAAIKSAAMPAVLFGKKLTADSSPLPPPQIGITSSKNAAAAKPAVPEGLSDKGGLFGKSLRGLQRSATAAASASPSASDSSLPSSTTHRRDTSPLPDSAPRAEDKPQFSQLKDASATTAEERYKILDLFDKSVKQGLHKQSDISTARATKGTCLDMCPEKERYMREFQRRVHIYETLPGTESNPRMDHSRAVKEYSRSSADQEEPLPSDLRPAPVLERTMNYLVVNVMDAGSSLSSWGDWYDFLWDRTRGIRKDITQQHLCDETAVSLVEKCARFHVFCAERLCEEAVQAFDRKINDENLTKCLQTLREMYHDLRKVRTAPCPNEAEFRGYMVLMKLNEGDTLREVQQLEPDLRKSPEIQFVLSVYASLESKNYTRFFKLLKSGTFLNACLMHRYFNQIRLEAVKIMMKAYKAKFSLDEFVRLLKFEDDTEAMEFCTYYGLPSSTADATVVLHRSADYVPPEIPLKARRAISLVEQKMTTSIGQIINGGPLPEIVLSSPLSSFDSDNRFIHMGNDGARPVAIEAHVAGARAVEPNASAASDEVQRVITADLCLTVVADLARTVAAEALHEVRSWLNAVVSPVATSLLEEVMVASLRTMVQEVCSEQRAQQVAALRQAEMAQSLGTIAGNVADELIAQVVASEGRSVAEAVYRFATVERQQRMQALDECAQAAARQLIDDETRDFAERVARDFHRTHVVERLAELENCSRSFELRCKRLLLGRWCRAVAGRRRLRSFLIEFPPGPLLRPLTAGRAAASPAGQAQLRLSNYGLATDAAVAAAAADPGDTVRQRLKLDACVLAKRLKLAEAASPLNVARIVAPLLERVQQAAAARERVCGKVLPADGRLLGNLLCFKLLLLLPGNESTMNSTSSSYDVRWPEMVAEKLSYGPEPTEPSNTSTEVAPLLSLYSIAHGHWQACACIRAAGAELNEVTARTLAASGICRGTTAVLCALPSRNFDDKDAVLMQHGKWMSHCRSFIRLALGAKPAAPAIPLLLLVPTVGTQAAAVRSSERQLADGLQLDELLEQGVLSAAHISFVDVTLPPKNLTNTLTEGLQWLAAQAPAEPRICCRDATRLVESVLAREFYTPTYEDLATRQELGLPHQDPDRLLSLYNDVVARLAETCSLDTIEGVSWPPLELCPTAHELPFYGGAGAPVHYNSAKAAELLRSLTLPTFGWLPTPARGDCSDAESTWSAVCQHVSDYTWQVCDGDEVNSVYLFSRIRGFLKKAMLPAAPPASGRAHKNGGDSAHRNRRSSICRPCSTERASECIPWTDIVLACIEQRLTTCLSGGTNVWYHEDVCDQTFNIQERVLPWPPAASSAAVSGLTADGSLPMLGSSEGDHEEGHPPGSWLCRMSTGLGAVDRQQRMTAHCPEANDGTRRQNAVNGAGRLPDPIADSSFVQSLSSVQLTLADEKALSEKFEARLQALLQQQGLLDDLEQP